MLDWLIGKVMHRSSGQSCERMERWSNWRQKYKAWGANRSSHLIDKTSALQYSVNPSKCLEKKTSPSRLSWEGKVWSSSVDILVTPPSNPMCIGPLAFMLLKLIVSLIFGLIQILILIHSQTRYHQYLSTECAQRCISHKPTHPGHFILLRSSGLLLSQLFMDGPIQLSVITFPKTMISKPKLVVEDPQSSASLLCWCFDWCELYVDVLCWSKSLCKIFISTSFSLLNIEFYLSGWRRKSIRAADRWVEWQGQGYYILGRRSMGCIRTHRRLNASVHSTYRVFQKSCN